MQTYLESKLFWMTFVASKQSKHMYMNMYDVSGIILRKMQFYLFKMLFYEKNLVKLCYMSTLWVLKFLSCCGKKMHVNQPWDICQSIKKCI